MYAFHQGFDGTTIRLKKLGRSDILAPTIMPKCLNCFPRTETKRATCTTSCPYGISQRLWIDAGRPLGANKTGNPWLDCVGDPECALKAALSATKGPTSDCTGDAETSCSDHYSSMSSNASSCLYGKDSIQNFREIEGCILKNFSRLLDLTEADLDPRVGFRVKHESDMDTIYVCDFRNKNVFFSPSDRREKIHVYVQVSDKGSNAGLKGIFCIVPQKLMENMAMKLTACPTLFDCEVQTENDQRWTRLRTSQDYVHGEPISEFLDNVFGKIITNPPKSGVVFCGAQYVYSVGYIWDVQHFFTGLDTKLYFVSSSLPVEAVISLRKTNSTTPTGLELQAECSVATFIMFPHFEFLVQYSNGTLGQIEKSWQQPAERPSLEQHQTSQRLTISYDDVSSFVSIRCRAPYRNSKQKAEAVLLIKPIGTESKDAEHGISRSQQIYLPIALSVGGAILCFFGLVLCGIFAIRKHKKSKTRRQLTTEDIQEFWSGNTAVATSSINEVIVDSIGFPERFQIPPTDLKMNMEELLGEGEFGLCVRGNLRGRIVAVKAIKASADVEAFKDFLREVKIMAYLGEHENIDQFLGTVVNLLRFRMCLAVFELSPFGDLLSYLRRNHPENHNLLGKLPHEKLQLSPLDVKKLSYFCEQIAAAMQFVVEKRLIHGDLAARNVLVFPNYIVKVSDFGLSRKLYTTLHYKKKSRTPLPWRWMALESLKYMEFSPMSDMWAFGVTAWEIFTFGQVPHSSVAYSREFVDLMQLGHRLERPKNTPEEIYQFMKLMWDRSPSSRPSFEDAKISFRIISIEENQRLDRPAGPL